MKFLRNENPKVKFVCSMDSVKNVMPIIKSSKCPRPWLKKISSKNIDEQGFDRSTLRCPGIAGVIKDGYILRAWTDITIELLVDGNYTWKVPHHMTGVNGTPMDVLSWHDHKNLYSHLDNLPKHSFSKLLKLGTPWFVHVPKGYKLLQLPAMYVDENRFTPYPGHLEDNLGLQGISVPLIFHEKVGTYVIEAGTPLCQFIPIKVEDNPELVNTSFEDEPMYKKMYNDKIMLEYGTWKRSYSKIKKYWNQTCYK